MSELSLLITRNYGAPILKKNYQKYFSRGLLIAAAIHLTMVGIYWASVYLSHEEPSDGFVKVYTYTDLGPPPSISESAPVVTPAVSIAGPIAKPSVGIPVPVPDTDIRHEQNFATQEEMNTIAGPIGDGDGTGNGQIRIEKDIKIENDLPPEKFVYFEKAPVAIKKVAPIYPELARKAGMTGRVTVHLWIDKEGK